MLRKEMLSRYPELLDPAYAPGTGTGLVAATVMFEQLCAMAEQFKPGRG